MTEQDTRRKWQEDPEASAIFGTPNKKPAIVAALLLCRQSIGCGNDCRRCGDPRCLSVDFRSATTQRVGQLLRGNVIREVSNSLPEEIDLLVYA